MATGDFSLPPFCRLSTCNSPSHNITVYIRCEAILGFNSLLDLVETIDLFERWRPSSVSIDSGPDQAALIGFRQLDYLSHLN